MVILIAMEFGITYRIHIQIITKEFIKNVSSHGTHRIILFTTKIHTYRVNAFTSSLSIIIIYLTGYRPNNQQDLINQLSIGKRLNDQRR